MSYLAGVTRRLWDLADPQYPLAWDQSEEGREEARAEYSRLLGGNFAYFTTGNGAFVTIVHPDGKRSAFLQGDDASTFADDVDAIESMYSATVAADAMQAMLSNYSEVMS